MALLLIYVIELVTFTASSTHYSTSIWKSLVFRLCKVQNDKKDDKRSSVCRREFAIFNINKNQHINTRAAGSSLLLLLDLPFFFFQKIHLVIRSVLSDVDALFDSCLIQLANRFI